MLQSMGSQRVGHDWATEQQQQSIFLEKESKYFPSCVLSCRNLMVPDAGRGCQNNETKLTGAGYSTVFLDL